MEPPAWVSFVGFVLIAAYILGYWKLRRREKIKKRPFWQVYVMFTLYAVTCGVLLGVVEDLLSGAS